MEPIFHWFCQRLKLLTETVRMNIRCRDVDYVDWGSFITFVRISTGQNIFGYFVKCNK